MQGDNERCMGITVLSPPNERVEKTSSIVRDQSKLKRGKGKGSRVLYQKY